MFIAALFTAAKIWKQPKCPSTDEWIKKIWCIYIHVYVYIYTHVCICVYIYIYVQRIILIHKKNENLPFATTGTDLEGIVLSEVSQRKKYTVY